MNGTSKTTKGATGFGSSCTCGLDALGPVEAERWTPGNSDHLHYCPQGKHPLRNRETEALTRLAREQSARCAAVDYYGTEHACQLIPTRAVVAGDWGPVSYYGSASS